jgi:hypothetical protein
MPAAISFLATPLISTAGRKKNVTKALDEGVLLTVISG